MKKILLAGLLLLFVGMADATDKWEMEISAYTNNIIFVNIYLNNEIKMQRKYHRMCINDLILDVTNDINSYEKANMLDEEIKAEIGEKIIVKDKEEK